MSEKERSDSHQTETRSLDAWKNNYRRGVEKTTYLGAGAGALLVAGTLADRSFPPTIIRCAAFSSPRFSALGSFWAYVGSSTSRPQMTSTTVARVLRTTN